MKASNEVKIHWSDLQADLHQCHYEWQKAHLELECWCPCKYWTDSRDWIFHSAHNKISKWYHYKQVYVETRSIRDKKRFTRKAFHSRSIWLTLKSACNSIIFFGNFFKMRLSASLLIWSLNFWTWKWIKTNSVYTQCN